MAILKEEFGIGPRDKQRLNFEWETKKCMGMGALPMTSDCINTSHGHSLGREMWVSQLWVVTAEQRWKIPILMPPVSAMDEWVNG